VKAISICPLLYCRSRCGWLQCSQLRCGYALSWRSLLHGLVLGLGICLPFTVFAGVDVNLATVDQLIRVKGIGAATAQRIVAERARGPYESLEHLSERLSGIGAKRLSKLRAAGLCAGVKAKPCAGPEHRVARPIPQKSTGDVATPEVIQLP
jgi:competence protein ComEA